MRPARRRWSVPAALAAMALAAAVLSPAVGASSSSLHPKGLSAQLQDGVVTLSWNAPVDDAESVTGYQILRRRPGVDPVGTFHVVADDTATSDASFTDRCADQPGTAYTYRVKARRGDQLSRWGNYSRVNLAAGYVAADPQTGCDPDTGAPAPDPEPEPEPDPQPEPDPGDNGDGGDPDGDDGGGVADSSVTVRSDASYQQDNQDDKQFVPDPDGEGVVLRSSHDTGSAQFDDRSEMLGLPASYPTTIGGVPALDDYPDGYRYEVLEEYDDEDFLPRNFAATLGDDGITLTWDAPEEVEVCLEYDIERVRGTPTVKKESRDSVYVDPNTGISRTTTYDVWVVTETGAYWNYSCPDGPNRRALAGYEIYRTSFGHVYDIAADTVRLLSDSGPVLIHTHDRSQPNDGTVFTDESRDARVGPRSHIYQIRSVYQTSGVLDRNVGSRLSEGVFIHRERDAARRDAESPQGLTISIPTKQAVADSTTLAINLDWDPPAQDASSVTGYVIQRRLVTQSERAMPFADIATVSSTTQWSNTGPDVTATVDRVIYDNAGDRLRVDTFDEIAPLTQFSYRVIAVRGTDRSNPSKAVSVDSERQLPADGLVTVTDVWRTGATIRVNMTGTGLTSVHAAHHLALAAPKRQRENRLLHVGIGATGWGHNTCIGNPGPRDLSPAALEALGFFPDADTATTQQITDARQTIEDWLDAVPGRRLADYGGTSSVKPDDPQYNLYGANFAELFGSEGCMHTDDASVTVSGLQPGTAYTAEALFRLVSEEQFIGSGGSGFMQPTDFIPTWDGGSYPGGIWSPAHLVGRVTFTTDP
ncbi:fibronectin type III domain-containing protein [Candidatus Poriferisodalis sp.]|uniref:fibronectin type III domain-containing protein n=1 Tax=Candidatus Poriferisodalis sp. TaxID=3101277 RepID=UPI003B5C36E5